jgi:hypothetical protein
MSAIRFSFPITKFEKLKDGRMVVEGCATSEELDSDGDIMDYEGSKIAFSGWRGNIREAHDKHRMVGKKLDVQYLDDEKKIMVRAFISAAEQGTQTKVEEGVLAAYSVGGGSPTEVALEKRDGKQVRRVLRWPMSELSLVDAGANPDTNGLLLVKADGSATEQLADEAPAPESKKEEPPPEPNRFAKAVLDALGPDTVKKDAAPPEPEPIPAPEPAVPAPAPEPAPASAPEPVLAPVEVTAKAAEITNCEKGDCGKCQKCMDAKEEEGIAAAVKADAPAPAAAPSEKTEKHFGEGEQWDIAGALTLLNGLHAAKFAEQAEGEAESPCLTQLNAAITAVKNYIKMEAGELVAQDGVDNEDDVGAIVSAAIEAAFLKHAAGDQLPGLIEAAVTKAVAAQPKPDFNLEKADQLASAVGQGLAKTNSLVSKVLSEVASGDFKAMHEKLEKIAKQPAVSAPVRFASREGIGPPIHSEVIKALETALMSTNDSGAQTAIRQQLEFARLRAAQQ